jgi:hypothetical protein
VNDEDIEADDVGIREGVFVMVVVLDSEILSVIVMDEVGVRGFESDEELLAPSDDEVDGEGILELEGVEAGVLDWEHRKPKQEAVEVMEGVHEDEGRL